MDFESVSAGTFLYLAFHFVVDDLIDGARARLFPIRAKGSQEFLPVDVAFTVAIEHVGYSVHFKTTRWEFGSHNSVDEVFTRDGSFVVLVHLAEQVRHTRFLVVHELHKSASPVIPAEVLDLLQFLKISQFVLESALSIPGHHPNVAPSIPQLARSWIAWKHFSAHLAGFSALKSWSRLSRLRFVAWSYQARYKRAFPIWCYAAGTAAWGVVFG